MTTVRIREKFKISQRHNKISGHCWIEHGPTTGYEVVGAVGVHSSHKSYEAAEREATELQAFYDKFGL